jgi:hypothetical protein
MMLRRRDPRTTGVASRKSFFVGAAVDDRGEHAANRRLAFFSGAKPDDTAYSAHGSVRSVHKVSLRENVASLVKRGDSKV